MIKKISLFLTLILFIYSSNLYSQTRRIVRFAYFEPGSYYLHKVITKEIKNHLSLITPDSIDIIFEPYGYRSAEWNRNTCRTMARDLAKVNDIDMVLAIGPWVVEDLLDAGFDRPIIGVHQFDPEAQGLVDMAGRPQVSNLTVNYIPDRYRRDVQIIRALFDAKEIGLLYFPSGDEFEKVKDKIATEARRQGAEVIAPFDTANSGNFSPFGAYKMFPRAVDVIYLPPMWGMTLDMLAQFFENAANDRFPTFATEGILLLEKGGAVSSVNRSYKGGARFTARKIIDIINGSSPADLPTVFEETEAVSVNLNTARRVDAEFSRPVFDNAHLINEYNTDDAVRYSIDKAIRQALDENSGLRAINETYNRVIAEACHARSAYLPHLNLELGGATTSSSTYAPLYDPNFNRKFHTDIIAEQMLFSYPAIKDIQAAKVKSRMADASLEKARQDLKQNVVRAYLSVIEAEDMVTVWTEHRDRLLEYLEIVKADVLTGASDSADIYIIEKKLSDSKIQLLKAKGELRITRLIFNSLTNRPVETGFMLDRSEFAEDIMVRMVKKLGTYVYDERTRERYLEYLSGYAVDHAPAMSKSAFALEYQNKLAAKNKGRFLPEVSLRGGYTHGEQFDRLPDDPSGTWTIGAVMRLPIFLGGERFYLKRMLDTEMEELLYARDSLRFSTVEEIHTTAARLTSHLATLPLVYSSRIQARDNLEMIFAAYSRREFSILDLLDFTDQVIEADSRAISDMYAFYNDYACLLHTLGAGYMEHGTVEETEFYRDLEMYLRK